VANKTLYNFQVVGALYASAGGAEAQAGDEVRLFLDRSRNPDFPEYIDGLIQLPVKRVNVISNGCIHEGTSYTFSYDSDDLDGAAVALGVCDITEASPITCCLALREDLVAETAARTAAEAVLAADIETVQADLDTWDTLDLSTVPTNGALGTAQVETQTAVGSISSSGDLQITVGSSLLGAPVVLNVPVLSGDSTTEWTAKVAAAIEANASLAALFLVDNLGAVLTLTARTPAANDTFLNVAYENGTAAGITEDLLSVNTTAGVAPTVGTVATRIGQQAHVGERVFIAIGTTPNEWVEAGILSGTNTWTSPQTFTSTAQFEDVVTFERPVVFEDEVRIDSNLEVGHYVNLVHGDTFFSVDFFDETAANLGKIRFDTDQNGFTLELSTAYLTTNRTIFAPDRQGILATEVTVIASIPTTGFTQAVSTGKLDYTYYFTPAGTLATGTFTLPTAANSRAGQIVRAHSTEEVTSVTVSVSGGGTIGGAAVTQFVADTTYAWQCVSVSGTGTWIRI